MIDIESALEKLRVANYPHVKIFVDGQPFNNVRRLIRETPRGDQTAVVATVQRQSWITEIGQNVVDVDDPFPNGLTGADIWGGSIDRPLTH